MHPLYVGVGEVENVWVDEVSIVETRTERIYEYDMSRLIVFCDCRVSVHVFACEGKDEYTKEVEIQVRKKWLIRLYFHFLSCTLIVDVLSSVLRVRRYLPSFTRSRPHLFASTALLPLSTHPHTSTLIHTYSIFQSDLNKYIMFQANRYSSKPKRKWTTFLCESPMLCVAMTENATRSTTKNVSL